MSLPKWKQRKQKRQGVNTRAVAITDEEVITRRKGGAEKGRKRVKQKKKEGKRR